MAKTLTIAGVNFMPQYKMNSTKIREFIQNKPNVMNFQIVEKNGDTPPREGSELIFKDGSRFLFAGFISRVEPREVGIGEMIVHDVETSDYGYIFNSKIVRRAYQDKTLKFIVENLMGEYVDSGYGFTTNNVQTGATLNTVTFDHITLRQCFEKLAKLTGFIWFVDYEKNLFFQDKETDTAPEAIRDDTDNVSQVNVNYDISQIKNSVIVIGTPDGEQSASSQTDTFTADGDQRTFVLKEKPSSIVSIKVDGVTKIFSTDINEKDSDNFVSNFEGKYIRQTEGETTLVNGVVVAVEYFPRVPIIVQLQDATSIAFFAALDSGDGVYENTIKDSSILSTQEALERAQQELDEFADALAKGIFKTRTGLLDTSPDSIFEPGQTLTVKLPDHNIAADTGFLIQEVHIELMEDENIPTTEYFYTVFFGGKVIGIQEFLESLAKRREEQVSLEDEIQTIQHVSDSLVMSDAAPTQAIFTPPFEWGPGGSPQFVWSFSQWK